MWGFVTPQLAVRDLEAAQRWYRDVLGLKIGFTRPRFGSVRDEAAEIFLAEADAQRRDAVTCCVRVEDADQLYVIYRERDVQIVEPIATRAWGVREFTLRDPDGHLFRIGHSTRR
jgi:catechol 2,3-dioxygenase-like lactoylglutathione lyase family enzyme